MRKKLSSRHVASSLTLSVLLSMIVSGFFALPAFAHASAVRPHSVYVHPIAQSVGQRGPDAKFKCQNPGYPYQCFGPQQIRNAYAIQPLLDKGVSGRGRTIVIVDAFQSPTVQQDLDTFSSTFGIPSAHVNVIAPDGLTPFDPTDPNQVGWAEEISLDVQWSHAVAPGATIDLVLGKSNQDIDLLNVTRYAVDHSLGDTISQSFGEAETCVDPQLLAQEHQVFAEATRKHITLFASSGDQGAAQGTCDGSSFLLSASFPAADPFVTAVGGTHLNADLDTGKYSSETVWSAASNNGGTGGGFSTIYKRPWYQFGTVAGQYRGEPDVSYNADPNSGVLTYLGFPGIPVPPGFFSFGGTSASSPQWAGITALADEIAGKRLGLLNPAFYLIGHTPLYKTVFHDITEGNNTFIGAGTNGVTVTVQGYNATKGWDATTGWGSPIVAKLVPVLIIFDHIDDVARQIDKA